MPTEKGSFNSSVRHGFSIDVYSNVNIPSYDKTSLTVTAVTRRTPKALQPLTSQL
jgi:hypothetical protein